MLISQKKKKKQQLHSNTFRDSQSEVDNKQEIDRNYYQKKNRPKKSLIFFFLKCLPATMQPIASNTIALIFQLQIHNSSTIYKFEQNQLAATSFSNPKPTNINTTTNKTREIKSK